MKAPAALATDPKGGLVWALILGDGPRRASPLLDEIKESSHRVVRKVQLTQTGVAELAVDVAAGTVWVADRNLVNIISMHTKIVTIGAGIPNDGRGVAI